MSCYLLLLDFFFLFASIIISHCLNLMKRLRSATPRLITTVTIFIKNLSSSTNLIYDVRAGMGAEWLSHCWEKSDLRSLPRFHYIHKRLRNHYSRRRCRRRRRCRNSRHYVTIVVAVFVVIMILVIILGTTSWAPATSTTTTTTMSTRHFPSQSAFFQWLSFSFTLTLDPPQPNDIRELLIYHVQP